MLWHIELKFCTRLCFNVLQSKFESCHFAFSYILKELCLFLNLEYRKSAVFHIFLLYALTYWAEILHMTLFSCTTDQVWVSSLRQFLKELCLFLNLESRKCSGFHTFLPHALTYIELTFFTWLCFNVLQIKFEFHYFASVFEGVIPLCELRI